MEQAKRKMLALSDIKANQQNPRSISESRLKKLVNSILVFPRMLELRPIVIQEDNIVLGGNMRLTALNRIAQMSEDEIVAQDKHLADNQQGAVRCGDNGIFKGTPVTPEQALLAEISNFIYNKYMSDGKYIYDQERNRLIVCQSNLPESENTALSTDLQQIFHIDEVIINPLGAWTGGLHTDCGATNRKLGSDMGDSVTGGGLHGKDLSKADVSVNVVCFMRAQETGEEVTAYTAIGDDEVTFHYANGTHETQPYEEVVRIAREYIKNTYGSFECFAEHGLVYYGINGK